MNKIKPKILVVVPSFKILGGVASHYMGLKPYWQCSRVRYVIYGKRRYIPAMITLLPDYLWFLFQLLFTGCDIVVVNPSLRPYQLRRDSLYVKAAKLFGKRVVTFIHGWDDNYMEAIVNSPTWFLSRYSCSDRFIVLYSGFKRQLVKAGIEESKICLSTTKVDDSLLEGFDISERNGHVQGILYLARADRAKRLDIVIKAFEILKAKHSELRLDVCGIGDSLAEARDYVESHCIKDVNFAGFVKGDSRIRYFKRNQIYILPTTHGEGMATSVLEAMAMGMVVISRPLGGVNDFFVNGEHGFLTKSLDAVDYAAIIDEMIDNPKSVASIAANNHRFAREHFLASRVAKSLEDEFNQMINENNSTKR